jgi:hypothetical protein
MPNGLLILFTFALYGICVYGPDIARYIGWKHDVIGEPYKPIGDPPSILDDCDTLRDINARRRKG